MKKTLLLLAVIVGLGIVFSSPIYAQSLTVKKPTVQIANSFHGEVAIIVADAENLMFFLYDLLGKEITQTKITQSDMIFEGIKLRPGIYMYLISSNTPSDKDRLIGYFKIQ